MKEAKNVYNLNQALINKFLSEHGYPQSYNGLLSAVADNGDMFLFQIFNLISSNWSSDEGDSLWSKFKNIFHKATDTLNTANNVASGANTLINGQKNDESVTTPEPENKSTNLIYWGIGSGVLIIILIIILIVQKKA